MPKFTIYDMKYEPLVEFSTERDGLGEAISIGASPKCKISLANFPEVASSIADMHFSIVRKKGQWKVVNPGNDLKLPDGRHVEELPVSDGMALVFGLCGIKAELDTGNVIYDLAWRTDDGETVRTPIATPSVIIGSAKYCDIVLESAGIAAEHARITLESDTVFIEDLGSPSGTELDGKPVIGKIRAFPGKLILFGGVPAKIVETDTPDTEINFSRTRVNWKALNLFLFLAVVATLSLWGWRHAEYAAGKRASGPKRTTQSWSSVRKDIGELVAKGASEVALAKLDAARGVCPDAKSFTALKKAISLEASAVENLFFYDTRINDQLDATASPAYIKYVFSAPDGDKDIETSVKFWKDARRRMEKINAETTSLVEPVFEKYGFRSFSAEKYSSTKKAMAKLLDFYGDYIDVTSKWRKNDWEGVVVAMNAITTTLPKNTDSEFKGYLTKITDIARIAINLERLTERFSDANLWKYDTRALKKQISTYRRDLRAFQSFDTEKTIALSKRLDTLDSAADFLDKLKSSLEAWRGNRGNFETFRRLTAVLDNGAAIASKLPPLGKTIKSVNSEIAGYIAEALDGLHTESGKPALERCREIENFIIASGELETSENALKLSNLENKIKADLKKRCDSIFEAFQEAQGEGDFKKMTESLELLLKNAPDDSKYHVWATKQLKRMKR